MKSNKTIKIENGANWEAIIQKAQDYKYIIILHDHYIANAAGEYSLTSILPALYKNERFWFDNEERPVHTVILTDIDVKANIDERVALRRDIQAKVVERYRVPMPLRPACDGRATERTQPEAFAAWRQARKEGQAKIDSLTEEINQLRDRFTSLNPGFPVRLYEIER